LARARERLSFGRPARRKRGQRPHFAGWNLSPDGLARDPNRIYWGGGRGEGGRRHSAGSAKSIQLSDDGVTPGSSGTPRRNQNADGTPKGASNKSILCRKRKGSAAYHPQFYDCTQHPVIQRVWLSSRRTPIQPRQAGVEDAALSKSHLTVAELARAFRLARDTAPAPSGTPARRMCLHTSLLYKKNPNRISMPFSALRARSAPTTAVKPGRPSPRAWFSQFFPIRTRSRPLRSPLA